MKTRAKQDKLRIAALKFLEDFQWSLGIRFTTSAYGSSTNKLSKIIITKLTKPLSLDECLQLIEAPASSAQLLPKVDISQEEPMDASTLLQTVEPITR